MSRTLEKFTPLNVYYKDMGSADYAMWVDWCVTNDQVHLNTWF